MTISPDLQEQTETVLEEHRIKRSCKPDRASPTWCVSRTCCRTATNFLQCWPVLRKYFGSVAPAAMMISAGLADPRMKIEIEVTALKQAS
jgi:enamine deaminase RidA (YjgF/YER057c/UK114 family)